MDEHSAEITAILDKLDAATPGTINNVLGEILSAPVSAADGFVVFSKVADVTKKFRGYVDRALVVTVCCELGIPLFVVVENTPFIYEAIELYTIHCKTISFFAELAIIMKKMEFNGKYSTRDTCILAFMAKYVNLGELLAAPPEPSPYLKKYGELIDYRAPKYKAALSPREYATFMAMFS